MVGGGRPSLSMHTWQVWSSAKRRLSWERKAEGFRDRPSSRAGCGAVHNQPAEAAPLPLALVEQRSQDDGTSQSRTSTLANCRYSVHGALRRTWRSAPSRDESQSKSATPRKHPGFKGTGCRGPWAGQVCSVHRQIGHRVQGTWLCRHLSRLTRCPPILVSLPFSTFRSPVESRLQISDCTLH
jgi:hypothetical protein